ncbi:hypothetical protein, partial [Streptomyces scabiei]|uniref:hypothetical protein n=1 Tax=Streptomyces scabiei TaxID=1930 RepID=UPI0038F62200
VQGEPGIGRLLDDTRDRYVGSGGADRPRDWDLALAGSVRRFGLPPVTLPLSKTERKALKARNRKPRTPDRTKGGAVTGTTDPDT